MSMSVRVASVLVVFCQTRNEEVVDEKWLALRNKYCARRSCKGKHPRCKCTSHFDWSLPGGKVERGENPMAAALRELREETGLQTQDYFTTLYVANYNAKYSCQMYRVTIYTPHPIKEMLRRVRLSNEHMDKAVFPLDFLFDEHTLREMKLMNSVIDSILGMPEAMKHSHYIQQ